MNKLLKNKRALTPVVAAVAVIAVMIAVAIVLALFMGSIATSSMAETKLKVNGVDFTVGDSSSGRIAMHVTNSLDYAVTIGGVRVNGESPSAWSAGSSNTLASGVSETFTITCAVSSGTQYTVYLYNSDGSLIAASVATA